MSSSAPRSFAALVTLIFLLPAIVVTPEAGATLGNSPPRACFTVTPDKGASTARFSVDAGCTTDDHTPITALRFRWDWTDDGTWDADYAFSWIAQSPQYSSSGPKTIRVGVSDGLADSETTRTIYVNTPPVLTYVSAPGYGSDGADPDAAGRTSSITFKINYTDADGDMPSHVKVRITEPQPGGSPSINEYAMGTQDPSPNPVNGIVYTYTRAFTNIGTYSYQFVAIDNFEVTASVFPSSSPLPSFRIDPIPELAYTGEPGYVNDGLEPETPIVGEAAVFKVRYSHPAGTVPEDVKVVIDGTPYPMTALPGGNIVTGVNYQYSTTSLSAATHSYYFTSKIDSANSLRHPSSGDLSFRVNRLPILSFVAEPGYTKDGAEPEVAQPTNAVTFKVRFTDADNTAPTKMEVVIDGTRYAMTPLGTNYAAGVNYQFTTTTLTSGPHAYRFEAEDSGRVVVFPQDSDASVTTLTPTLPTPLKSHAAVWVGEYAYLLGGRADAQVSDTVLRYNPITGVVETVGKLAIPVYDAPGIWNGRYIFLFGGKGANSNTDAIQRFDPLSGETTVMGAKLPLPLSGISAVLVRDGAGDKVYLFGGVGDSGGMSTTQSIYTYSPGPDSLVAHSTQLPTPSRHAAALLAGSEIYLAGGKDQVLESDRIVKFTPSTGTVTTLAARLPEPRVNPGGFFDGKSAFFVGGSAGSSIKSNIYRLDPQTSTLTTLPTQLPTPLAAAGVVWDDAGRALILGGAPSATTSTSAIHEMRTAQLGMRVNHAPTVSFTGETNYVSDGVHPDVLTAPATATFRMFARDGDGAPPKSVRLVLGDADRWSLPMLPVTSGTFANGLIYETSLQLPVGYHPYHFEISDGTSSVRFPSVPASDPKVRSIIARGANRVANGDFETDLSGWGFNRESGVCTFERSQSWDHTGSSSLKITSTSPPPPRCSADYPPYGSQLIPVIPGEVYFTTGFAHIPEADPVFPLKMKLELVPFAADGTRLSTSGAYVINALESRPFDYGWTAPPGAAYASFTILVEGKGSAYVDAIEIRHGNTPVQLQYTGLPGYTSDGVEPNGGQWQTPLTFRVVAKELDGQSFTLTTDLNLEQPDGSKVWTSYPMTYVSGDPALGATYTVTRPMPRHDLEFRFRAVDILDTTVLGGGLVAPLVNDPPVLTFPTESGYSDNGLLPDVGDTAATYTFKVHHRDGQTQDPVEVRLHLDDDPVGLVMNQGAGSPATGHVYSLTLTLPAGQHTYQFRANDGLLTTSLPAQGTLPLRVNSIPTLLLTDTRQTANSAILPASGHNETDFTLEVTYRDAEGTAPTAIQAIFSDGRTIPLTLVAPGDVTQGVRYHAQGRHPAGAHTYYVTASDDLSTTRLPATGSWTLPVNGYPAGSSWGVTPSIGNPSQTFTFIATAEDSDGTVPTARLHLDADPPRTMPKIGTVNGHHLYSLTLAGPWTAGPHTFHITVSDGTDEDRLPASPQNGAFTVNLPPTLAYVGGSGYASDAVEPDIIAQNEPAIFRIRYTDPENDPPAYVRVHVGTNSPVSMSHTGSGVYEATTTPPVGAHAYWIEASDGLSAIRYPPHETHVSFNEDWETANPHWQKFGLAATRACSTGCVLEVKPKDGAGALERRMSVPINAPTELSFKFRGDTTAAGSDVKLLVSLGSGLVYELFMSRGLEPNNGFVFTTAGYTTPFYSWNANEWIVATITFDPTSGEAITTVRNLAGTLLATSPVLALPGGNQHISRIQIHGSVNNEGANTRFDFDDIRLKADPLLVVNGLPTLSFPTDPEYTDGVNPDQATWQTPLEFRVVARDPDGNALTAELSISNGIAGAERVWTTYPMQTTGTDTIAGVTFTATVPMPRHAVAYKVVATDAYAKAAVISGGRLIVLTNSAPTVAFSNQPPLVSSAIHPSAGDEGTSFTFAARVEDAQTTDPLSLRLFVDGDTDGIPMYPRAGGIPGRQEFETTLTPSRGPHEYYFEASDGLLTTRFPSHGQWEFSVNGIPSMALTGARATQQNPALPTSGNTNQIVTMEVTYIDPDGSAPQFVLIRTNHETYPMSPVSGDPVGGQIFRYEGTFPAGVHAFVIEASDGASMVTLPSTGSYTLDINAIPTLEIPVQESMTPQHGRPTTVFKAAINYTDLDETPPQSVLLHVTGFAPISMTRVSGSPFSGRYEGTLPSNLGVGSYPYHFTATDGRDSVRHPVGTGALIFKVSQPPTLSFTGETNFVSDAVHPDQATIGDEVTFKIRYTDPEGEPAAFVHLILNKSARYNLQPVGGGIYQLSLPAAPGVHSYSFEASDGAGIVQLSASQSTQTFFEYDWHGWHTPWSDWVSAGLEWGQHCPVYPTGCSLLLRGTGTHSRTVGVPVDGDLHFTFTGSKPSGGSLGDMGVRLSFTGGHTAFLNLATQGQWAKNNVELSWDGTPTGIFASWQYNEIKNYGIEVKSGQIRAAVYDSGGAVLSSSAWVNLPPERLFLQKVAFEGNQAGDWHFDDTRLKTPPLLHVNGAPTLAPAASFETGADKLLVTPQEWVTFKINYSDFENQQGQNVRVHVGNLGALPMTVESGGQVDWATFSKGLQLPLGSYPFSFVATDGSRTTSYPRAGTTGTIGTMETFDGGLGAWSGADSRITSTCTLGLESCAVHLKHVCCNLASAIERPVTLDMGAPIRMEFYFRSLVMATGSETKVSALLDSGGSIAVSILAHGYEFGEQLGIVTPVASHFQGGYNSLDPKGWKRIVLTIDPATRLAWVESFDRSGNILRTSAKVAIPATAQTITGLRIESGTPSGGSSGEAVLDELGIVQVPRVTVNTPPALTFTGEAGYTDDGYKPWINPRDWFRIKYTDIDGDVPTEVRLLFEGGTSQAMAYESGQMSTGAIYQWQGALSPPGSKRYAFEATSGPHTIRYPQSGFLSNENFNWTWNAGLLGWSVTGSGATTPCTGGIEGCSLRLSPTVGNPVSVKKGLTLETHQRVSFDFKAENTPSWTKRSSITLGTNNEGAYYPYVQIDPTYGPEGNQIRVVTPNLGEEIIYSWPSAGAIIRIEATLLPGGWRVEAYSSSGALLGRTNSYYFTTNPVTSVRFESTNSGSPLGAFTYDNILVTGKPASASADAPILSPILAPGYETDGVEPHTGLPDSTPFTFRVKYTSGSNVPPHYVRLHVDTEAPVNMTLISGTPQTGAIYGHTRTLRDGTHAYYFSASDGISTTFYLQSYPPPHIIETHYPPPPPTAPVVELTWTGEPGFTADGIEPTSSPGWYRFRVRVKDTGPNADPLVRTYVSGSYYTMKNQDGGAALATGAIFSADVLLTNGQFEYAFQVISRGAITGLPSYDHLPLVIPYYGDHYTTQPPPTNLNNPAILSLDNTPGYSTDAVENVGSENGRTFKFRIHYRDPEGYWPPSVHVVINGDPRPIYPVLDATHMRTGSPFEGTFTLTPGAYQYSFIAWDGVTESQLGTTFLLNVGGPGANRAPTLTSVNAPGYAQNDLVEPNAGPTGTSFAFRVKYADADRDPPSSVRLFRTVNGGPLLDSHALTCTQGDYVAGVECSVTIAHFEVGAYAYYLEASDGWGWSSRFPALDASYAVTETAGFLMATVESYGDDDPGSHTFWANVWSNGTAPNEVALHLVRDGTDSWMTTLPPKIGTDLVIDNDYTDGVLYSMPLNLPRGSYQYYFTADFAGVQYRHPTDPSQFHTMQVSDANRAPHISVSVSATRNGAPVVIPEVCTEITLDASETRSFKNPETLTFEWRLPDGRTVQGPKATYRPSYGEPSPVLTVRDGWTGAAGIVYTKNVGAAECLAMLDGTYRGRVGVVGSLAHSYDFYVPPGLSSVVVGLVAEADAFELTLMKGGEILETTTTDYSNVAALGMASPRSGEYRVTIKRVAGNNGDYLLELKGTWPDKWFYGGTDFEEPSPPLIADVREGTARWGTWGITSPPPASDGTFGYSVPNAYQLKAPMGKVAAAWLPLSEVVDFYEELPHTIEASVMVPDNYDLPVKDLTILALAHGNNVILDVAVDDYATNGHLMMTMTMGEQTYTVPGVVMKDRWTKLALVVSYHTVQLLVDGVPVTWTESNGQHRLGWPAAKFDRVGPFGTTSGWGELYVDDITAESLTRLNSEPSLYMDFEGPATRMTSLPANSVSLQDSEPFVAGNGHWSGGVRGWRIEAEHSAPASAFAVVRSWEFPIVASAWFLVPTQSEDVEDFTVMALSRFNPIGATDSSGDFHHSLRLVLSTAGDSFSLILKRAAGLGGEPGYNEYVVRGGRESQLEFDSWNQVQFVLTEGDVTILLNGRVARLDDPATSNVNEHYESVGWNGAAIDTVGPFGVPPGRTGRGHVYYDDIFVGWGDFDGDGLADDEERTPVSLRVGGADGILRSVVVTTSPMLADTDRDGRQDGAEILGDFAYSQWISDPTDPDTDRDGILDGIEARTDAERGRSNWLSIFAHKGSLTCEDKHGNIYHRLATFAQLGDEESLLSIVPLQASQKVTLWPPSIDYDVGVIERTGALPSGGLIDAINFQIIYEKGTSNSEDPRIRGGTFLGITMKYSKDRCLGYYSFDPIDFLAPLDAVDSSYKMIKWVKSKLKKGET